MVNEVPTKWLKIGMQVVWPLIRHIYFIGRGVFLLRLVTRGRRSARLVTNLTKKMVADEVATNWHASSIGIYKSYLFYW